MKSMQIIIVLMLVSISIMAQLPGAGAGEALILRGLNKQLDDQVKPIVFPPFGTVVTADIMKNQLEKYFPYIKVIVNTVNEKLPNYVVQVVGYANPPGDKDTQDAKDTANRLSAARANAVRNVFIAKGLKAQVLVAVGAGDADRITSSFNNNADEWGKNRRVILKIVKK